MSAYDAGLTDEQRERSGPSRLRLGRGHVRHGYGRGPGIAAGDYLAGRVPPPRRTTDEMARGDRHRRPHRRADHRRRGAARRDRGLSARAPRRSTSIDAAVLGGLADQAAIAITNARLIEELERSQAAVARRADTERALRDITARIAALRDPDVILDRVVEEAAPAARHRRRAPDPDVRGRHIPRPGGRRGRDGRRDPGAGCSACSSRSAAGSTAWPPSRAGRSGRSTTPADPRIPHERDDDEVAGRLGLCGMAAAPLRAPGGEVIGTLAISTTPSRASSSPRSSTCSRASPTRPPSPSPTRTCYQRLTESEDRYRFLVENSPDVVWSTDADGNFTFMSDAMERLTGWRPEEVHRRALRAVVHDSSRELAEATGPLARPGRRSGDRADRAAGSTSCSPDGRLDPGRVQRDRHRRRGRARSPASNGIDPRHQRAGPPRARAARVGGALPLPRRPRRPTSSG